MLQLAYNPAIATDSYKSTHYKQFPPDTKGTFYYIESRSKNKHILPIYKPIIEEALLRLPTIEEVEEAKYFWDIHVGKGIFNYDGWKKIVDLGYYPMEIEAVPEGTIIPTQNVIMTIKNTEPDFYWLPGWMETQILQMWYPTTVATRSWEIKQVIKKWMEKTCDTLEGLPFKLHDFGFRGVSSYQSAMIGGLSHLVNFMGTDTTAAIVGVWKYYDQKNKKEMPAYSLPACYDEKTEILTEKGWKRFDELDNNLKVAQYNKDGSIEFVNYTNKVSEFYDGKMYRFNSSVPKRLDICVTPNHRMIRFNNENKICVTYADDTNYDRNLFFKHCGFIKNGSNEFTPIDAIRVAFQADGSFFADDDKRDGSRSGCKGIRFKFKKQRKIDRLCKLLKEAGLDYTQTLITNGTQKGQTHFYVKWPVNIPIDKNFEWVDISKLTFEWGRHFIKELQYWDGKIAGKQTISFSTVNRKVVDIVSAIGTLCGYFVSTHLYKDKRDNRKNLFTVSFTYNSKCRYKRYKFIAETYDYKGNIYCITVPSGMLVVRRNDCVVVCGNSEHSTITAWGKEREREAYESLLDEFAKPGTVVACVSDSYDLDNAISNIWGKELKQKVINSGATVVIRPDSGEPKEVVVRALKMLANSFGYQSNSKGYNVINYVKVIQGDGISNPDVVDEILEAVVAENFSVDNISFGMGGGLLQQVNRDTYKFAMKCSAIYGNNGWYDVFKCPKDAPWKASKKGLLTLYKTTEGKYVTTDKRNVVPFDWKPLLNTVFKNGDIFIKDDFETIRKRSWD